MGTSTATLLKDMQSRVLAFLAVSRLIAKDGTSTRSQIYLKWLLAVPRNKKVISQPTLSELNQKLRPMALVLSDGARIQMDPGDFCLTLCNMQIDYSLCHRL